MMDTPEFQEHNRVEQEKLKLQNLTDFQNEMAGRETGRQKRYFPHRLTSAEQINKEQEEWAEEITALMLRLQNDAVYAKLYHDMMDMLSEAELKTDAALNVRLNNLDITCKDLENIQANAARLSDGKRVYRNNEGDVYLEDRTKIRDRDLLDSILWKGDEPTYEEYTTTVTKIETMQSDITDLNDYRINVLGTARDRMEDEDNPVETDEMEELQQRIQNKPPQLMEDKNESDANITFNNKVTLSESKPKI